MTIAHRKISSVWFLIWIMSVMVYCCVSLGLAQGVDRMPVLRSVGDQYFENRGEGVMWTKMRSKRFQTPSDVQDYLDNLNTGRFNDWRLPTKQELYDLLAIFDLKKNGEVKVRIEGKYWLVNNKGETSVGAWEIGDGCGPERRFFSGDNGYVRAIRP